MCIYSANVIVVSIERYVPLVQKNDGMCENGLVADKTNNYCIHLMPNILVYMHS